jgi:hypothetical protein
MYEILKTNALVVGIQNHKRIMKYYMIENNLD